ncbi:MAG: tetratricopeptide repeat protein [Pseudomonadales bacterium]
MTKHILFAVPILLLTINLSAFAAGAPSENETNNAAALREAAETALADGDVEEALDHYLVLVDVRPNDLRALEMAASLAQELGVRELAGDLMIQRIEVAVRQGNQAVIAQVHEDLSALWEHEPEWVQEKLRQASRISEPQREDVNLWQDMTGQAKAAMERGDFETALTAQEGAVFLGEESLGLNHWMTLAAKRDLGFIHSRAGNGNEAEAWLREAASGAAQALGEEHPWTLEINELLAELYGAWGNPQEAEMMHTRVLAGYEDALGPAHPETIEARYNLIEYLEATGNYQQALDESEVFCAEVEQYYGTWHPRSLECHKRRAALYADKGDLDEAEVSYQELVDRMSEVLPAVNEEVLSVLSQIAEIYRQQGRYNEARDLLSGVIQTALQVGEVDLSYTAKSYLGRVFNDEGEYGSARKLLEEVVDYGEANWQDRPLDLMNSRLELGAVYQHQGKLGDAEYIYRMAHEGLTNIVGKNHPSTIVALNNLGLVYEQLGLYDEAEPRLKEALSKFEQVLGPANAQTSRTRNNLALLHESQGNFREAEPLYIETLEHLEEDKGPDHTDTVGVKNNLAFLYMLMQEYDKAATMFDEVMNQWMQLFGEDHQRTLKAMNNLARVYRRQDRLSEAEPLFVQALQLRQSILGPEHLDSIRSMIDLGVLYKDQQRLGEAINLLTDALALAEKVLGEQHPYTFDALNALADTREEQGELQAALALREQGFHRRSEFLDRMLWVTGENAREGYIRLHRPEFDAWLSLLTRIDDPDAGKRALNASLQRKGLLLKITSEVQQISALSRDPQLKTLADDLRAAREALASRTLSGPMDGDTAEEHTERLYELEREVNELQGELGRASARYRSSIAGVSIDDVEAALPDDSALVDFLTYEEAGVEKMLAGVVINDGGNIRYELVIYPDRKAIQDSVVDYRTWIQDDLADEEDVLEFGQIAYDQVWAPVADAIGEMEYVHVVPDGILNILPFPALVDQDAQYLIETRDLHMLSSGRDLLPNDYERAQGDYIILAGPDYDADQVISAEQLQAARRSRSTDLQLDIRGVATGLRGLNFDPLPGALEEGEIITDQVREHQTANETYFGEEAQEQVLNTFAQPPRLLHMATHGFFLEPDDTLRRRLLKLQRGADIHVPPPGDNPLLRSGLAFAGVNNNAEFLGEIDTNNDGVLTALEVLDMDLSGTNLVVLSACETGLGEIHEGEGVYGLKRSFQEAGVAEVVASLWEVSDDGTQALMTAFYERILEGMAPREALRATQREMLDSPRWGYPFIWSAFMITGSYESAGYAVQ